MSDPIDIKALDEYLKGDSDISRTFRELGGEDVPPELDRRVLNEARAAVASGGGARSRSWLRWSAPLALAASVVLVVTVVIESGVQNDASFATEQVAADKARVEQQAAEYKLREQVAQEPQQERQREFASEPPAVMAPQAPAAPVPAAAPPPAPAKSEIAHLNAVAPPEEVAVDAKARRDQSQMTTPVTVVNSEPIDSPAPQSAAEQPAFAGAVAPVAARKEAAPATPEADSADDVSSVAVTSARARRAGRTAGPRATTSGSPLATESRPVADEDLTRADLRSDPQKWLEEIRELRRAGKVEDADRAWEQFHKAFPNFPVADDDLARKQR